jgi:hypothetical protein
VRRSVAFGPRRAAGAEGARTEAQTRGVVDGPRQISFTNKSCHSGVAFWRAIRRRQCDARDAPNGAAQPPRCATPEPARDDDRRPPTSTARCRGPNRAPAVSWPTAQFVRSGNRALPRYVSTATPAIGGRPQAEADSASRSSCHAGIPKASPIRRSASTEPLRRPPSTAKRTNSTRWAFTSSPSDARTDQGDPEPSAMMERGHDSTRQTTRTMPP